MIGSLLTRGLLLIFGYAYPAYECYKTVELNKPDIQQLQFWCQYWILVAGLTVCERFGDTFIGWLPMYGEAKLAFFIYLWFPKTKGTTYVYSSFFRPYVAKHETEIDRNLIELRTRAGDMAVLYWQKAASYGQMRVFNILQYIASQSSPPRPAQPQQQGPKVEKPGPQSNHKSVGVTENGKPSSPVVAMASSSEKKQEDTTEKGVPSGDPKAAAAATAPATMKDQKPTVAAAATAPATMKEQKPTPAPQLIESTKIAAATGQQIIRRIDSAPKENNHSRSHDVALYEPTRVTRNRLRKTHSK